MKRITNTISLLLAIAVISFDCNTHGADAPGELVPHEIRLKAAQKPYNIARYFYLTVEKENEEAFLKLYKERLHVRQHQVEAGKFLWFGLFKARDNDFGSNYVISVGTDSVQLEGGRKPWEIPHLPANFSADRWKETTEEIYQLRAYNGSMMVALRDYTVNDPDGGKWPKDLRDIVLNIGYMKPVAGQESLYMNVEQEVFQNVWQKRCESDPSFIAWGFHSVISNDVEGMDFDFMTTAMESFY